MRTIIEILKAFRSCLVITLAFIGASFLLILLLWQLEGISPPPDSHYKKELEYYAQDKLPSCKILRKKYKEADIEVAIIRLDATDYSKLFRAVQSDTLFISVPTNHSCLNAVYSTLQKEAIVESELDYIYSAGRLCIAFKSPDKVIYQMSPRK
jgi:hypothetical protein